MKRIICIILSLVFVFGLCSCRVTQNESTGLSQEITIVKMPSPPKCKTTDDITVINEVLELLNKMEKTSATDETVNGGWTTMIKLKIDGQEFNYTIGSVFTDSDGRQYNITNYQEIEDEMTKIYNKLDVTEVQYP